MSHLTRGEQAGVDAARDCGGGRVLAIDTPAAVITALQHKELIVKREGRWLLTPRGVAQTSWAQFIRSAAL